MTQQEFLSTSFGKGDEAIYKKKSYRIKSVDFEEMLIGIIGLFDESDEDDVTWLRCENIEYVPAT